MDPYARKFHGGDWQYSGLVQPNGLKYNNDDVKRESIPTTQEAFVQKSAPKMYAAPGNKTYDSFNVLNYDKTQKIHMKKPLPNFDYLCSCKCECSFK